MRRNIAKLLEAGQEATARISVENIIQEENMMAAQEIFELIAVRPGHRGVKVGMDSLHLVHIKLLAADLLSLTVRHTSPPSFACCGRTIARAEVVGVVVSRDHREKFLRFLVDDGTGCMPCVLWLNHQYMNANSSSGTLDSDPTGEMALTMSEVVSLGTLLRVRGRIVMYRGAIQIAVRDVVLEKDPNAEVLHWLQCVHLAKECYDLAPFSA